jgi:hypothetical protein
VLVIAVGLDARRRVQDQRLGDAGDKNDYFWQLGASHRLLFC